MAAKDAEMPTHTALREEADKIAKHLQTLRKDIEGLTVGCGSRRTSGRPSQGCGERSAGGNRRCSEAQSDQDARHRPWDRLSRRRRVAALTAIPVNAPLTSKSSLVLILTHRDSPAKRPAPFRRTTVKRASGVRSRQCQ